MRVSIVTVCYNSAATIRDTLDSVAAQTHGDIEHIVIDGGSTDDTLRIVRQAGRHVATLVSERDRGIYDAMNKGFALATGDLIGTLNADDMLAAPDTVARIAAAAQHAQADAVFGDLVYVEAKPPHAVLRHWRAGPFERQKMRFGWMPPHPTFYVSRQVAQATGPFATDLRIAADYDYVLRVLRRPGVRAAYVPHVIVRMRAGGISNGSMRGILRKSREDLSVMRRNGVGGVGTLVMKNLRKAPQLLMRGAR